MGNAGCVLTVNCADANTHRGFEVELYTVSSPGGTLARVAATRLAPLLHLLSCGLHNRGWYLCVHLQNPPGSSDPDNEYP